MIDLTFNISENDCETIHDDDNLIAACIRRLDTVNDTTLYEEYGSDLTGLLGLRKTDVNLEFLNQSVTECLLQDERITNCNVDCEYTLNGLSANISLTYEDNELEFTYETGTDAGDDDTGDDE